MYVFRTASPIGMLRNGVTSVRETAAPMKADDNYKWPYEQKKKENKSLLCILAVSKLLKSQLMQRAKRSGTHIPSEHKSTKEQKQWWPYLMIPWLNY